MGMLRENPFLLALFGFLLLLVLASAQSPTSISHSSDYAAGGEHTWADGGQNPQQYVGPQGQLISGALWEDNCELRARPGTISRLRVRVVHATYTADVMVAVVKNGLTTPLAVTIPAGTEHIWAQNETEQVSLVTGDTWGYRVTLPSGGLDQTTLRRIVVEVSE